ncbi:formyltransferase family protein [uncultured Aquimarina sp.]|uniref:formyltransferase family protein n=1 Tax=uncultured Aquimarina sp. TaxID=575652 RepID=UPI00261B84E0|nr:formyltransferase family protein [uncultured Aquimarina sp.]
MKNVVFLGSKKIGLSCLQFLYEQSKSLNYNILGILTNSRGKDILEYAESNKITVIDNLDEYLALIEPVDIAISVQYHQILRKEHINKAKEITVNLHMAPLPEYRGCNQFSFAILEDKKEFGTTIHRLEEGIDSGDIIFEKRFPMSGDIWVQELHHKTHSASVTLFEESLENLIQGNYVLKPQKEFVEERGTSLHYRKEINDIKKIDLDWSESRIEKHIRATYFPGFEPPYCIINSQKIYFKIEDDKIS